MEEKGEKKTENKKISERHTMNYLVIGCPTGNRNAGKKKCW